MDYINGMILCLKNLVGLLFVMTEKKEWYLRSVRHLKDSLSEYTEIGRKHDIVVMWNKTNKLIKCIEEFNKLSIDKVEQIDPMTLKKISRPTKNLQKLIKNE
jgi:hypothetical protein